MAREFNGSTQGIDSATGAATNYPYAFCGWFYQHVAGWDWVFSNAENATTYDAVGVFSDGKARMLHWGSGSSQNVDSTTTSSLNTWHHVCGIFISNVSRRVYLDGGGEGTGNGLTSKADGYACAIGVSADTTPAAYFDGRIAEVAVWDVSVYPGGTDGDKATSFKNTTLQALAAGYSPLFFPGLMHYWPLGGAESNNDADTDVWGGNHMDGSRFAAPTTAEHPPGLIYPVHSYAPPPTAGAAPGLSIPVAMHEYRQRHQALV